MSALAARPQTDELDRDAVRDALSSAGLSSGGELAVAPLPGGASRDVWTVTAGGLRYVLRRDPPGSSTPGSRRAEFEMLERMAGAGVPVPRALHYEPPGGRFGTAGFLMEHVEGESLPRRVQRTAAPELLGELARALAAIHRAGPGELEPADPEPWRAGMDQWKAVLRELGEPAPVIELGLRWLARNQPPARPPTTVHGDFRLGNFLVGADGHLRAVIDWEFTHAGDGHEDIGWLSLRSWRFGVDERRVGGLGELEAFLAAYSEAGGEPPTPQEANYWELHGNVKWAIMCAKQADLHLSGERPSVELASLGRRRAEIEWDAIQLMLGSA